MATKVEMYRQMADHATAKLTFEVKDWIKFLFTAGKLYKYNFMEILMVWFQRPEAQAVAEFNYWTKQMGRRIRRGSKGIALLCQHGGRPALRYVFDVSDTVRLEHSRDPMIWEYTDEYQAAVTSRLTKCFKITGAGGLDKQLVALAIQSAENHWHDFRDRIIHSVHDSLLDELDEDNVGLRFRNAVTVSLSFLLLARCGFDLDNYFTPEDFQGIGEFNTRGAVSVLGSAVSESASVILRQVEYAIKKYERDKAAGALPPAQPPELDAQQGSGYGTAAA